MQKDRLKMAKDMNKKPRLKCGNIAPLYIPHVLNVPIEKEEKGPEQISKKELF